MGRINFHTRSFTYQHLQERGDIRFIGRNHDLVAFQIHTNIVRELLKFHQDSGCKILGRPAVSSYRPCIGREDSQLPAVLTLRQH